MNIKGKTFAVAPMMDWTDRHCRVFHRAFTRYAVLYTEMVTARAIRHGDRGRLLDFDRCEQPVVLQLGGSEPGILAEAARIGEDWGYSAINLNVGCPSDRVQGGHFGACLMATPALVAECVAAMIAAVNIPVTVKCRIGIDDQDDDADLQNFVEQVSAAGCGTFIVHARKAWLKGLSPKENREIPPLNYERVYRLKQSRPDLAIHLNGGIETLDAAERHLRHVDGVMIGRAAYHTPWMLHDVDRRFAGLPNPCLTRLDAMHAMMDYVAAQREQGVWLQHITRHMLGLFHGEAGGRHYRRVLSEEAPRPGAEVAVLDKALHEIITRRAISCAAE